MAPQLDNLLLPQVQTIFRVKLLCLAGIVSFMWILRFYVSPTTLATEITLASMIAILPALVVSLQRSELAKHWVFAALVCDLLALTIAIHFGGGADQTSGPILYAVIVLLGGVLISEAASSALTFIAIAFYVAMVAGEGFGLLVHHVAYRRPPDRQLATAIMVSIYLAVIGWLVAYVVRLLRRSQRLAQEMRAEAVRFLAHDLRNALSAISGHAEIIAAEDKPASDKHARRISFLALETAEMLTNMIDATSTEARPLLARHEAIAPKAVLERVRLWFEETAADLGVSLKVNAIQAPSRCLADGPLLERALNNLVNNALRHVLSGGCIEIGCRKDNEAIVWWVRDDGHGIDPALLPRIFEPFVSGESSVAPYQHSGLGLYIVRRVAQAHGGEAKAKSVLGRGSEFEISFPLRVPDE